MHAETLYKEHDYTCGKLPFGVCGAHTYHTSNRAFKSFFILNVPQLDQNHGYVPGCMFAITFCCDSIYLKSLFWLTTHLIVQARKEPQNDIS